MLSALLIIKTTSAIISFILVPAKALDVLKVVAPLTKRITRPKELIP